MERLTLITLASLLLLMFGCQSSPEKKATKSNKKKRTVVSIPDFNSDSAFHYIEKQVEFGPRVPNTEAHRECANYLVNKLGAFTDTAFFQSFKARAYNGTILSGKNIIGSFRPGFNNRILLCAHWDTRPVADHDPDPAQHDQPIDGANDGGSGVGVLLEIARQLSMQKPGIGIDIILFDAEDYGPPQSDQQRAAGDWWALGSQHWSRNPHVVNYYARYGILLDMVGAKDAKFYMEGYSMNYAPGILKKVWNTAHRIGYQQYFIFEQGGYIDDDHKYVNEIRNIPTINIIHLDPQSSNRSFFEHWHTIEDTMDKLSRETLKAVGQTLLTVIYEEK